MRRNLLRIVARSLVGVLLFAQLAIAAYACPGLASTMAADAQLNDASVAASSAQMQMQMAACDSAARAMDPASANLCAEHCKYGQQSDQAPTLVVPAVVLTALYANPLAPEAPAPSRPAAP